MHTLARAALASLKAGDPIAGVVDDGSPPTAYAPALRKALLGSPSFAFSTLLSLVDPCAVSADDDDEA